MPPQELVDMVIDHLHDDPPTLYSCSLVCRSWLDSSRLHKFNTIDYGCNFANTGRVKSFTDYREATPLIHNIISCNYIARDISICTNLTYLKISDVEFTDDMIPLDIPTLTSLQLNQCRFGTTRLLACLSTSFPRLISLGIRNTYCRTGVGSRLQESEHNKSPSPPFTGEFTMIDTNHDFYNYAQLALLDLLLSWVDGVHFSSICVKSKPFCFITLLNALLKSCGSRLKRLDLRYLFALWGSPTIDLSYNTELRELMLPTMFRRDSEPPEPFQAEWQYALLSSLSSSSLHTVHADAVSWDADLVKSTLNVPNTIIEVVEEF